MARSGLVSYGGDSEISDSEDERTSISSSPPVSSTFVMPTNNLGIPLSQPLPLSPPPLPTMRVEAAPTTALGLVDYTYIEEEDDRNDTKADVVEGVDDELVSEQMEESEMLLYQGEEDMPSIELDENSSSVPLFLRTENILLPPEPTSKCSNNLQSKITALLQKKAISGVGLNSSLHCKKNVRNPSILEKMVHFCDLNEFGTNYPEHLYKPNEFAEESMYDNLYMEQMKDYNAKKEKAKLNSIEFVTATKKPSVLAAVAAAKDATAKEKPEATKKMRRTKWDIGTGNSADSGGSRGTSPAGGRERPALLGNAPIGLQPRVLQPGIVGTQARAQASQVSQELKKAK